MLAIGGHLIEYAFDIHKNYTKEKLQHQNGARATAPQMSPANMEHLANVVNKSTQAFSENSFNYPWMQV
jgi:hypothetical protein